MTKAQTWWFTASVAEVARQHLGHDDAAPQA
jgi:hypothetical protein